MHEMTPTAWAASQMRPATCVILDNLMDPSGARVLTVQSGTRIRDLDPKGKFPAICRLDGEWLLRAGWDRYLLPGQVVEFCSYPQGGGEGQDGSSPERIILMIAAVYLAVQFGQFQGVAGPGGVFATQGAAQAFAMVVLTTLINGLVPVDTGNGLSNNAQSNSYTANASGNQARLEQPIPVLYGRNKTFPDFAGEAYQVFGNLANPTRDPDDQYYHAVFVIGQGNYVIESKMIDDTNLSNFSDVTCVVLPPGSLPTLAKANVVNAAEVTGNTLTAGRYAGPFIGCRAKSVASQVGIDISCSRGLATYDAAGVPGSKSVSWNVEWRKVDDFGFGISEWAILASETLTASQTKPLRRSYLYTLPTPCRPQIRVYRTTPFDDNARVANTIEWAGLKCYLQGTPTLCTTATHMEIRMRASEQLSGLTQRKIAVISRRMLRTRTALGAWTAEVETRNYCWALADKWTNSVYGDGYTEDHVDLQGLYDRALIADARQDRFDGVFDQTYDSLQADQMIAQSGRSAVFRRNGVITLTRDELRDLPVTAFTARNIQPGSLNIDYTFANESTPDGVIVEYWHNRVWDWQEVICPAPGVTTPVRPHRMRLFGVTGPTHAQREGLYQAANSFYRRKYPSFSTELEGMLPAFGSAVAFAPSLPGWGRGGDVVSFNTTTLEMTLSETPDWNTAGSNYISFLNRDGSLTTPYLVTPGSDEFKLIMPSIPTADLPTSGSNEERPKYVFGAVQSYEAVLRVLSIRNTTDDTGLRTFTVGGVIEDDRVHAVDNFLLPTGGAVQDPVDNTSDDGSSSGGVLVVYMESAAIYNIVAANLNTLEAGVTFANDGVAYLRGSEASIVSGQWLLGPAHTPAECALFDIRATLVSGAPPLGEAVDSWLNLAVSRRWYVATAGGWAESSILLEVRKVSTGIVQGSQTYLMHAEYQSGGGE